MRRLVLAAIVALAIGSTAGAATPTPTPPAVGTQCLLDLVPGHIYAQGNIDGHAPDVSLSGDVWHITGGIVAIGGIQAWEETPGACAIINLVDGNAHYYHARIWMPTIAYQAEGGILIRASSNACTLPNTGDYFYVGFHGSSFGITDSDPRGPDERHYLSGAVVYTLISDLPTQAQPVNEGYGKGWHEDIEIYDDGNTVVVYANSVNVWGAIPIPWYSGNTYFGISGGDFGNVNDAVYSLAVISSDGTTPFVTPSPTATMTRTPTPTKTAIVSSTVTPTRTATPTPSLTRTASPTRTTTPTITATFTITPTRTITATPTVTPTMTVTPLPSFKINTVLDDRRRKVRRP